MKKIIIDYLIFQYSSKLSNGFIRNNCDVINFSYRNYLSNNFFPKLDKDIIEISKNYKPDLKNY